MATGSIKTEKFQELSTQSVNVTVNTTGAEVTVSKCLTDGNLAVVSVAIKPNYTSSAQFVDLYVHQVDFDMTVNGKSVVNSFGSGSTNSAILVVSYFSSTGVRFRKFSNSSSGSSGSQVTFVAVLE